MRKVAILLVLAFLMCTCNTDKGNGNQNVIQIGLIGSSSVYPAWAEMIRQSAYLAVTEINQSGGVEIGTRSYQLELVSVNDGTSAEIGLEQVRYLDQEGIFILLGPSVSSVVLGEVPEYHPDIIDGVADYAIKNGLLMLLFSATSSAITTLDDNDLVWRTCPSDVFQGSVAADYIYNNMGYQTVGIVHRDEAWGNGLAERFTDHYEMLGGEVSCTLPYTVLENDEGYDFTSQVNYLLEKQPDVIYLLGFSKDGSQFTEDFAKILHTSDYRPQFFVSEGVYETTFLENGNREVSVGMYGTSPSSPLDNPGWQQFVDTYAQAYGESVPPYGAFTYDAVYLIAYALSMAESLLPNDIKTFLRDVSDKKDGDVSVGIDSFIIGNQLIKSDFAINYEGASGSIEFDENGDPGQATYTIWRIDEMDDGLVFSDVEQVVYQ